MHEKRQLLLNALAAAAQVVVTGASFLVLYRYAKDAVGIELFGVWSLVLATTSTGSVANLGLATSVVKFVSRYKALNNTDRIIRVVETALLSLALFLLVMLIALYPFARYALGLPFEPALADEALTILPYSMASFWLTSVAGVTHGALDGLQRMDLRSILVGTAALLYLGLVFILVPKYGLVGLAQAQLAQAAVLLLASWVMLRLLLPGMPLLPVRWTSDVFREMLSYSASFQVISVFKLLTEPLTKWLVTLFGGAAVVGYYEFAHRMVFQLRALFVAAHQSVVPAIAAMYERQASNLPHVYVTTFRLILVLVLVAVPMLIALLPVISQAWLGSHEPTFITFSVLLFVGWFLNMLSNPAYFSYLGIGRLRWNVAGHTMIGALNLGLGYILGRHFGGTGVVTGFMVALLSGSLLIILAYHLEHNVQVAALFDLRSLVVGAASLGGLAISHLLYAASLSTWVQGILAILCFVMILAVPLYQHPMRQQIAGWVRTLIHVHPQEVNDS